jgi:alkylation response protein AidB-like acyl-CoA dehydrogenase
MAQYKAPLRDIRFVREEMLNASEFFQQTDCWQEANSELAEAINGECAKFSEEVLQPLNAVGDSEGCTFNNGEVKTPTGFKQAYQQYVEGGWPSMEGPLEYGGQNLPKTITIPISEFTGTANWSWGMYPGLSQGAIHTIRDHGSEEQKQVYLTRLIEGAWTGTMCLTEAHCGSDLGMLRTKAVPNGDGSYSITGTKIFISSGEHDLAENIVHIVLARLPDAPAGTRGISLFIVPKFTVDADGNIAERNALSCGSLEEKMGIHGNATCVMNFDGAKGFLIGPENRGLNCMFTFMNTARIGTAIQGLAHAEFSYQNSLAYAKDRLQMRSMSGVKNPNGPADPIIVHPDVRRMLLTQKAFAEGGRMLITHIALIADKLSIAESDAEKEALDDMLGLLTPIAKAFMTEVGFESANLGMQIFGGHGFIKEWGLEQNVRDSRISMLYEGTTGIQSLDLLGRKILAKHGKPLQAFITEIEAFCNEEKDNKALAGILPILEEKITEWNQLTGEIGVKAIENMDEINAACVDYLMYSGYITFAYLWAQAAAVASKALDAGSEDKDFYQTKIYSAKFYYQRILTRTAALKQSMVSGVANVLDESIDPFIEF